MRPMSAVFYLKTMYIVCCNCIASSQASLCSDVALSAYLTTIYEEEEDTSPECRLLVF